MPYSPLLNSGLPQLNAGLTNDPISLYSNKKIVSSSLPVRQHVSQISTMADELSQKLSEFEKNSANDVVLNNLKNR